MRSSLFLALLLCAPALARAQSTETRPPRLTDLDGLSQVVEREYPPELRARHVGGTVRVRLLVGVNGAADSARVAISSAEPALDSAGVRVASAMRFEPALQAGTPMAVWVTVPIEFHPPLGPAEDTSLLPGGRRELQNGEAVAAAVRGRYPAGLRADGIRATVALALAVDSAGLVKQATVDTTSCIPFFDSAAVQLATVMRFAPDASLSRGVLRSTTVRLIFGADSENVRLPGDSLYARRVPSAPRRDTARGQHVTVKPKLVNRDEVKTLLRRSYPEPLIALGIGGETHVLALVDSTGAVAQRQVARRSGNCSIDLAALRVAAGMRFSPGLLDGRPVPVWIKLPIIFRTQP